MTRIPFTFVGYAVEREVSVNVDPSEYARMSTPAISKALLEQARSINRNLSFFPSDFDLAAESIVDALKQGN